MPAFFCRNQALALPPSAVGNMSEGGVLIKPLLSCEQDEEHDQCSVYEGHYNSSTLRDTQRGRNSSQRVLTASVRTSLC